MGDKPCVRCGEPAKKGPRAKYCDPCSVEAGKEQREKWHREHPEATNEAQRRFRERHPERVTKRAQMFGVREDEFARMVAAQGGCCAICDTTEPGDDRGWNLDHDHRFAGRDRAGHRGVLCRSCNLMLGNAKDEERTLLAAVDYLRAHRVRLAA